MDGTAIMMSSSAGEITFEPNENKKGKYCLDISNLTPGQYNIMFVLYKIGEFGTDGNVDVIRDVYSFSVVADLGYNHNVPWNNQWWGHVSNGYLREQ